MRHASVRILCRSLLLLVVLCVIVAGAASAASRRPVIGVMLTADLPRYHEAYMAFVAELARKGYDQRSVELFLQTPNPDPMSWANTIRKFRGLNADLIVAFGAPAAFSAVNEAVGIPVVYGDVYGPVELGIARSMSTSGNSATGVSAKVPLITLLKMTALTFPLNSVGILYSSREAGSAIQSSEIKRAAVQLGFSTQEYNAVTAAAFESNLKSLLGKVQCLFVTENTLSQKNLELIIRRATEHKVPVISLLDGAGARGALFSLEASLDEQGQQAADTAVRILTGSRPTSLPLGVPRSVELVINLKTSRHLNLTVPFQVLSNGTKIIK